MICLACGFDNLGLGRFCCNCGAAQPQTPVPPAASIAETSAHHQTAVDDLKPELLKIVSRLVIPVAESLKSVNNSEISAREVICLDLMNLMLHFARLDGQISANKSRVFLSVYGILDPSFSRYTLEDGISPHYS
jgi:hypothetical protein